ncbi:hypothetical protein ACG3SL_13015 [Sphingomonas sp. CJ20]
MTMAPGGRADTLPLGRKGAVTARRQRITWAVYGGLLLLGGALWAFAGSPGLRAFGLGLWAPGMGFLASGGWPILLIVPTLALFGLAVFAWFGAGAIVAPVLIWLGAAWLAAGTVGETPWKGAPIVAALLIGAAFGYQARRLRKARKALLGIRQWRSAALPAAIVAVDARAVDAPADADRVLDDEMLSAVDYLLDRALQPVEAFDGFDRVDIFQTASVRYQINFIGYALSILQMRYLPNFRGYLAQGQRQLIEKYLQKRVWSYWIYESMWGHLNFTNWDPAAKDNIMLTGYFGAQVNLYMLATGDMRYTESGSLPFRLNRRTVYAHDAHSITRSIRNNMDASAYCLYPCEPNWIYPACNFRGMLSLTSFDTVFGTSYAKDIGERYWAQLEEEFTDPSGSIIALKSSITGMPFPFPASDLSFSAMANAFDPQRARRMWASARIGLERALVERDGVPMLGLPAGGIDFGNYRRDARTLAAASILQVAREFGDEEIASASYNTLNAVGGRTQDAGLRFRNGSNLANINAMQGIFARRGDVRRSYAEGGPPAGRSGPRLESVPYPAVRVAAARSDGEALRLVLSSGSGASHRLEFANLNPGGRYHVQERPALAFVADASGAATIAIELSGRTALTIAPVTTV